MKKKMEKWITVLLTAVLLMTLAGCGGGQDEIKDSQNNEEVSVEVPADTIEDSSGKILYFVVGNLGDLSYGDMGWWATQAVAEKYGYEYEVVEDGKVYIADNG